VTHPSLGRPLLIQVSRDLKMTHPSLERLENDSSLEKLESDSSKKLTISKPLTC
jgi:hypothetical protein